MSTSTRLSSSSPGAWALALTVALSSAAAAQEAPPPAVPSQGPSEQTLNVKFRGGSLTDYVSVVRNAGDRINIVLPPMADEVQIPALAILEAEVESALQVAAEIADDKHRVKVRTHRSKFGLPIHVIQVMEVREQNLATPGAIAGGGEAMVRVFSLGSLTERSPGDQGEPAVKPETVLTAVDTGLAVAPDQGAEKPVIRYHEDSGLLFVQGSPMQVNIVYEVLQQMENDIQRRRNAYLRSKTFVAPSTEALPPGPSGPEGSKKAK